MEQVFEFKNVERFDTTPIETTFTETPEGFLQGTAIVTRTGVFPYMNNDGSFRYELRLPENVFHVDSMESLKRKPVTNKHPMEGKITPKNAKKYAVGSTGTEVRQDGTNLGVDLVITDGDTIQQVRDGMRELSLGYRCDVRAENGEYEGTKYTHIQENIVINHCAVLPKGRAGSIAKIRIDGAQEPLEIEKETQKESNMADNLKVIKLDGVEHSAEAQVIVAYTKATERADKAEGDLKIVSAEKSTLEAERDQLKARQDELTAEVAELKKLNLDEAAIDARAKEKVALITKATKLGVVVTDGMSDKEIMVAAIKIKTPKVNLDGKDDTYIKAGFAFILDSAVVEETNDVITNGGVKLDAAAETTDSGAAHKRYVESQRNAWKTKE